MVSRLAAIARLADPDVTPEELADALWLAGFMSAPAHVPRVAEPEVPSAAAPPEPTGVPARPALPEPVQPQRPPTDRVNLALHLPPTGRSPLVEPAGVHTRSPAVPALPDVLALCRALLPLRRKVDSPKRSRPDEDATAQFIADTSLWITRSRPVSERWMDLALVVDDSASMVVWERTIGELRTMLQQLGAFRDIRVWRLDGDQSHGPLTVRGEASGRGGRPGELIDPRGRRVILLVSDCVGPAWGNGVMAAALAEWSAAGPLAIAQVLPQRLWADCLPDFVLVRMRATKPGLPNRHLTVRARDGDFDLATAGAPIPVFELEPRWLAPWARLVAGEGTAWINGTAMFTGLLRSACPQPEAVEPPTPGDRLRQFRALASTEAYRLAVCLAAAPLSLPVMRLVQSAMLPLSRPAHLAEVFLSGLLVRRDDGQDGADHADGFEYEFRPGVRDELLAELPKQDTLQVLSRVSAFVTERLGSPLDFRALLAGELPGRVSRLSRPFAKVTYEALNRLGGRYAEAARRLHEISQAGAESTVYSGFAEAPRFAGDQLPIMNAIPPRNPYFTGRADLLGVLHDRLGPGEEASQVLHGFGGVGKTQLAVEHVHRHASNYDLVWWIPADTLAQVHASLLELSDRLGLPAAGDVKGVITAVLDALRTGVPYRRWLLVFDNANRPEQLWPFLPRACGHVLITSRNHSWDQYASVQEVGTLDRPDSIALLQRRGLIDSVADAAELAELLGDLPLALEQAAAWRAETGMPVRDYLTLLEERFGGRAQRPARGYADSVAVTWNIAFDLLREESPAAAQLLELFAFFGPAPISVQMLRDGHVVDLPSPLAETLSDDTRLREAIGKLGTYALARIDHAQDRIAVHRLAQAVVRGRLETQEHDVPRRAVQQILATANPGAPDLRENWERHNDLGAHIEPAGVIYSSDLRVRRVVLDQIRYLYAIGDYESSQALSKLTVTAWRSGWGPDDELTLLACRDWANTMRALGDIEQATRLDWDTFDRFRRVFGENHEHSLAAANGVGAGLRATGRFDAARALDDDNLRRHRAKWGDDHPLTLRTANNLAVDFRLLGNAGAAFELDEDTVRRRNALHGKEDPHTLFAVSNLCRDLLGLGRYVEALHRQEKTLVTHRRILGATHNDVLLAVRTVVIALRRSGEYARAAALAEDNFVAVRRRLGEDHEHTLTAMTSYCNALRCVGDLEQARAVGLEALSRYRGNYFGPLHPFTLECAVDVALVLRHNGELPEARALNEQTLAALRDVLGSEHPSTLCCASNLSNDLFLAGEPDRALVLAEKTYRRSIAARGPEHPYTHLCALNAGHADRALASLTRILGRDHPEVIAAAAGHRPDCDVESSPS